MCFRGICEKGYEMIGFSVGKSGGLGYVRLNRFERIGMFLPP